MGQDTGTLLLEEADRLNLEGKLDEAEKVYDQLLTQNHDRPWLLATMGTLYLRMHRYGLAINLLSQAAAGLKSSEVLCNLGLAYKYTGQHDKAMHWMTKAVEKDRDPDAGSLATYAGLFINVGAPDVAEETVLKALKKDPTHSLSHWNYALALLEQGKWETAWDEMEWGFKAGMRKDRKIRDLPVWDGTKGQTVIVYGEQGLGDEIMFASMLPDMMRDANVILESHSRLETLFAKSFGIPVYGTRELQMTAWPDDHQIDARISIGSLGKFYRRSREAFPGTPYLKADPLPQSRKFRVGISWTGGLKEGRVRTRTVPLPWWDSIFKNHEVEFVSLQYTDSEADVAVVRGAGHEILEMPEIVKARDYMETAKLVASCDLVISVCTSVIHLAGALGVPCWVMVPNKPAWRYGVKGGMPWYRSVRLYRQPKGDADTWMPVVQKIGYDLEELLSGKRHEKVA